MDGFVWVPVSSLFLSLKSCIADPDFYCFNFWRHIYLSPCQTNGFCHRNLCDFVPCGDLASQVCGGWFGSTEPGALFGYVRVATIKTEKSRGLTIMKTNRKHSRNRKFTWEADSTYSQRAHPFWNMYTHGFLWVQGSPSASMQTAVCSGPGLQPRNADCDFMSVGPGHISLYKTASEYGCSKTPAAVEVASP